MSNELLKHFLEQKSSGLVHKPDARDHVLDQEILGAAPTDFKPLGRIEQLLTSPLAKPEFIVYQGRVVSCVHATCAFLNMWNSFVKDGNPNCQSWAYTYKQVKHYPGGTIVNEALGVIKNKGICLEETLSARDLADTDESVAQDPSVLTEAMHEEAKHFQIEGYLTLDDLRRAAMYQVLVETPVGVTGNVGSNFNTRTGILPLYNEGGFGHMWCRFDVLGESNIEAVKRYTELSLLPQHYGWWIDLNWWERSALDIRVISPNYVQLAGKILKDKRDTKFLTKAPASKDMPFKFIKAKDDPKVFLLNLDNKKCWVKPEMSFEQLFGKDAWKLIEELEPEVVASYPVGPVIDTRDRGLLQAILVMLKGLGIGKGKK